MSFSGKVSYLCVCLCKDVDKLFETVVKKIEKTC